MKNLLLLALVLIVFGCTSEKEKITSSKADYNAYLATEMPSKEATLAEIAFWQKRLESNSENVVDLSKLAGLHAALFSETGDVSKLHESEAMLHKCYELSARNKDTYLRSLAHNYISQHRFKEAKILLDSAYAFPDNKHATELMLFDVSMELGDYERADSLLGNIKNTSDFNYLIRLSKWSDYKGDLDAAIRAMEKAKEVAESGGITSLKIWTYTNIADYYGHAGRIDDAYKHYVMTLKLQPDNAYAKKGIAYIVYASEKNTTEANRILDSIMVSHKVPDYYLQKAELAAFDGKLSEVKKQEQHFIDAVAAANYGGMYNTYLIELYAETAPEKALALAEKEIQNRATPETYQLLAYAQLQAGHKEEALKTIETYVEGKTFEPKAAFHSALIYKANGMTAKIPAIKKELTEASFELGPVLMQRVEKL